MSENSVQALLDLSKYDIHLKGWLDRSLTTTYTGFINQLYNDLQAVAERLMLNPQNYLNENEDATTGRIADSLFFMGYECTFGQSSGGAVDITVEKKRLNFKWIGEAKRYNSITDLKEGFLQLSTRYTPGFNSGNILYGGLFAYLRRPNAASHMNKWRATLPTLPEATDAQTSDCVRLGALAFNSEHQHASMGMPMKIWHICFQLHHEPKDKSARNRKRRPPKKN